MTFLLKKLVSRLFFPLPLGLELLALGLVLEHFTRRKKLGRILVLAGAGWLAVIGYPWIHSLLLPPLARSHPPLSVQRIQELAPRYVAVPGMGIRSETNLPANLRFPEEFTLRLLEAARVHRAAPGSRLLISISNPELNEREKQQALADYLAILRVDPNQATLVVGCRDTEEEIMAFRRHAGTNTVCLVSSGANLPRAMLLARRHDLRAVAAPSSWPVRGESRQRTPFTVVGLFPSADNVAATERAFYEYLGLAFERLKGEGRDRPGK